MYSLGGNGKASINALLGLHVLCSTNRDRISRL